MPQENDVTALLKCREQLVSVLKEERQQRGQHAGLLWLETTSGDNSRRGGDDDD